MVSESAAEKIENVLSRTEKSVQRIDFYILPSVSLLAEKNDLEERYSHCLSPVLDRSWSEDIKIRETSSCARTVLFLQDPGQRSCTHNLLQFQFADEKGYLYSNSVGRASDPRSQYFHLAVVLAVISHFSIKAEKDQLPRSC